MSAKALLKKLDQLESSSYGATKDPKKIRIVSTSEYDTVDKEHKDILYVQDIDIDAYTRENISAPTEADQGRYLRALGL